MRNPEKLDMPEPFVTPVRESPVSVFTSFTEALRTSAPEGSVAVPLMFAFSWACAKAWKARSPSDLHQLSVNECDAYCLLRTCKPSLWFASTASRVGLMPISRYLLLFPQIWENVIRSSLVQIRPRLKSIFQNNQIGGTYSGGML